MLNFQRKIPIGEPDKSDKCLNLQNIVMIVVDIRKNNMIEDKTRRNFDFSSCSSISDPHLPAKCGDRWTQEDIYARNMIYYFLPTVRPSPGGGGPESPYLIRVALYITRKTRSGFHSSKYGNPIL
jgi:hypothetical protein